MAGIGAAVSTGARQFSKRIIASYILDWVVILLTAAVGVGFSQIDTQQHAFSLIDPNISFPKQPDTVSVSVLLVVSIIAPGVIIFIVSMFPIAVRVAARSNSAALQWRRRCWEWNTGWMGLGIAVGGAFMVTEGLKDLAGKPRPDFLARCDPDLGLISQYTVSGLGSLVNNAPIMVDSRICRNQSISVKNNGFAAWPSGHASFSWAGMLYLTLFLCAKFTISIPYLTPRTYSRDSNSASCRPQRHGREGDVDHWRETIPMHNEAAAPPVYLLILAFVPIGVASFITVSRWSDYRHAGFDLISGAILGSFFAWFGFRWYHLPIRTGAGLPWGSRSRDRAFYTGLGVHAYAGDEGWQSAKAAAAHRADLEQGQHILESGRPVRPGSETIDERSQNGELTEGERK